MALWVAWQRVCHLASKLAEREPTGIHGQRCVFVQDDLDRAMRSVLLAEPSTWCFQEAWTSSFGLIPFCYLI